MAQLDNAADSDSEERGFESLWAGQKKLRHLVCRNFFCSDSNTEGFEQGGSEAEENAPGEHFRRRGNERSEAIVRQHGTKSLWAGQKIRQVSTCRIFLSKPTGLVYHNASACISSTRHSRVVSHHTEGVHSVGLMIYKTSL